MTYLMQGGLHFLTSHFYAIFIVLAFLVAGAAAALTALVKHEGSMSLRLLARHFLDYENMIGESTKVDLVLYVMSKFTSKFVVLASLVVTTLLVTRLGPLSDYSPPNKNAAISTFSYISMGFALFLFTDFGWYLSHRVQHKFDGLWAFHKVHHSATFLSPLTTFRFHPLGNVVDGVFIGAFLAIPVVAIEYAYGLRTEDILVLAGTANVIGNVLVLDALHHSHFPISFGRLDYVLMSPVMHQVHHSVKPEHWGKNLGARLSLWDFCFGTGVRAPNEQLTYGLGDTCEDKKFTSVIWCYLSPFASLLGLAHEKPPQAPAPYHPGN